MNPGLALGQAIMLVESPDGASALLGRPKSLRRRGPVLTCLSGFIEQGESIEEAVGPPRSLGCIPSILLCLHHTLTADFMPRHDEHTCSVALLQKSTS